MNFRFPLGLALTASALSFSALMASPAQAQVSCDTGGIGGSSAYFIPQLLGLGTDGCVIGDKVYSDFEFTGAWGTTGMFGFTNTSDTEHTFSSSSLGLLTGSYSYGYKVTALNPEQKIATYKTDFAGSPVAGNFVATKTLANNINGDVSTATKGPDAVGGNVEFVPPQSMVNFTSTITVTDGRIDTFTDSLVQTPGPLPILGAGAAFGFSRKIRRRIKASA